MTMSHAKMGESIKLLFHGNHAGCHYLALQQQLTVAQSIMAYVLISIGQL